MSLTDIVNRIQHSNSTKAPLYPSLDGLRGLAILMVVLGHYWSIAAGSLTDRPDVVFFGFNITSIFQLAGYGVQLFFVMSAFLLYLPYARATITQAPFPSRKQFFLRRFLRIYPAYAGAIALYLLVAAVLGRLLHLQFPSLLNIITNLLFVHPLAVFIPGSTATPNLLQGTWSLVVEVYFYALLPFVALAFRRFGPMLVVSLLMIGIATYYRSVVHPLIGTMDITWQQRGVLLLNPFPYLDSFTIGMLSARAFVNAPRLPARYVQIGAPIAAALAICGIVLLFRAPLATPPVDLVAGIRLDGFFMFNALVGLLIPAMLLSPSLIGALFSVPLLRFIGVVSYSIFLTHVSLAYILGIPLTEWLNLDGFSAKLTFLTIIFVPAAIGLGFVLYMVFERPWLTRQPMKDSARDMVSILREFLSARRTRSIALGVFAWYGAAALFYSGLPGSAAVPEEVLFKAANLTDANWDGGVSRTASMILIPSDATLVSALQDKKSLVLEDGSRVAIKSLVQAGGGWVHLTVAKTEPRLMAYPHRLIGVR